VCKLGEDAESSRTAWSCVEDAIRRRPRFPILRQAGRIARA